MTIFKPKWLLKGNWYFFLLQSSIQFNNYPSDSRCDMKKVVYDVPRASNINDNRVYPCCGLFKLEKWKFTTTTVQTSYSLTDDSYLSLRHLSVISLTRIALPQRFCFTPKSVFIYVCLICLSCLSFYLYHPFLLRYAHHWISWWSGNSNFFNLGFRNCFYHATFVTSMM